MSCFSLVAGCLQDIRTDARAEAHDRAMRRLVAGVQELSLARTLDAVMAVVRRAARELTGADGATFVLRDGDKCFYADEDAIQPLWKGQRFPMSACISGWAMLHRRPAVIEDIYRDPRIPIDAYRPTFVRSLVMVPIRTAAPIGAIGNYWARQHLATNDELELLQALANTTSVAMENIQVYEELEERVKERTRQLESACQELDRQRRQIAELASRNAEQYNLELMQKNEGLAEALEAARQANVIKTRFLANMSHELRTPLNGIIGLSEVLQDEVAGSLTAPQKEFVGDVLASGRHLLSLVNNVLDLQQVELGTMEFSPEEISSADLLGEVSDVLRALAEKKHMAIDIHVDPGLGSVEIDPVRLRQVVYNYLSNAIKFSMAGGRIHVRALLDAPGTFRVEVADEGIGMGPEELSLMFAEFHRVDRTQKRENQGAGIGLALTKRIVDAQGGHVGVESALGKGSVFYAVLPLKPLPMLQGHEEEVPSGSPAIG